MDKYIFVGLLLLMAGALGAQTCTTLGQNPSTAFPVCGTTTFSQANVPICGSRTIPTPCTAAGSVFQDKNPYWYKFTCFTTGTLGFVITPANLGDDYDWQLFDITNKNPDDVYTDRTLFVACNWSGEGGRTGASSAGTTLTVCEGTGQPLFTSMPTLIKDHEYILLVSHFTNSQSGYSLAFGGGTADITDPNTPNMVSVKPACDGQTLRIKLNKKMKCNSLAANGSDFTVSGGATIISAIGVKCTTGFDMDSLIITLSTPLAPGNYTISAKQGSDGNTLLDNCAVALPVGTSLPFSITFLQPTPMDSLTRVGCKPNELNLVFKKNILCSSVAANGSDFILTGPSGVTITGASTVCTNRTTSAIKLSLSGTIFTSGNYTLRLVKGSDGNTILDECSQETPENSTLAFTTADTVSARNTYTILYGCKADTVNFMHDGNNGTNKWKWQFNSTASSSLQNPSFIYKTFGAKNVLLTVSNGVCSDSTNISFVLDNELKANFTAPNAVCPQDPAVFRDTSIGNIISWAWDFGNGNSSSMQQPPVQNYAPVTSDRSYTIRLIVKNDRNCFDTLTKNVKILYTCFIAVPTGFTPNGDGKNDYLYPVNAFKANDLLFRVYNRYGQLIFETKNYLNKWDGTINGIPQATGTYIWTLRYTHADTGIKSETKGTTVLLR